MLDYICTFIGVYTDVFILYIFLTQYRIKGSQLGKTILFLGFGLINIFMNILSVPFVLKLVISIVVCMLIIMSLCKGVTWYEALKFMIVFYVLLGIGELLIVPIFIFIEGVYDIELFYSDSLTYTWVLTLILSRIITIALIKMMREFFHKAREKMTFGEKILVNLPLLLAFIVAVIVEHYLINIEKFSIEDITSVLIILAILLVSFTITYIKFLESSIVAHKQESQIAALEHRNEMQYIFYEEKRKYENEIKRIRHDLKNHLLLIKENNGIKNIAYYNEILEIVESDKCISSGCNVFDVLINEKKKFAETHGIVFQVLVIKDISELNSIKERDLCSIFGNLLDNALENAEGATEAYVDIKVDIINHFFYMNIKNSFDSRKIRIIAGKLQTTKSNEDVHGIGLESVRISLEKCDGYMKTEYDNSVFSVEIMIPLNACTK